MPSWLRAFIDVNPITHLVTAVRGLMHGTVTAGQIGWVLLAAATLTTVFAPLTMHLSAKCADSPPAATGGDRMNQARFEVIPIGEVESPLTDRASAPKQDHEGSPDAWLVFEPAVLEGLHGIRPGDQVIVLTWLDRARRDVLRVHPRDDVANPEQGVFSTRSADRPNPIGLHQVEIASIDGPRVRVRNLEALDGTPIVDVKPLLNRT